MRTSAGDPQARLARVGRFPPWGRPAAAPDRTPRGSATAPRRRAGRARGTACRRRRRARAAASDAEPLEHRLVAPPLRPGLDLEVEEDLVPEQELDLRARAGPDLLDDRAALADDDLLLRLGLDEDRRADGLLGRPRRPRPRSRAAPPRGSAGAPSRGRAPRSGRLERQVGALLARVVRRAFGQQLDEVGRGARRSRRRVSALTGWSEWNSPSARAVLHLLGDVPGLEAVDLVQRDHDGHASGRRRARR